MANKPLARRARRAGCGRRWRVPDPHVDAVGFVVAFGVAGFEVSGLASLGCVLLGFIGVVESGSGSELGVAVIGMLLLS